MSNNSFNYKSYNHLHELYDELEYEILYFRMSYSFELEKSLLHFLSALRKEIRRYDELFKNLSK